MKNIYYQVDICREQTCYDIDGNPYAHAYVLIFVTDGNIETDYGIKPLIEVKMQSHKRREKNDFGRELAYIPNEIRHCNLTPEHDHVSWYGNDFICKDDRRWSACQKLRDAANLMRRIDKAHEALRSEQEDFTKDELKSLIIALRRLKALPVRYGSKGTYEIVYR